MVHSSESKCIVANGTKGLMMLTRLNIYYLCLSVSMEKENISSMVMFLVLGYKYTNADKYCITPKGTLLENTQTHLTHYVQCFIFLGGAQVTA